MTTFKFEAVNKEGKVIKDLIEAVSVDEASEKIRSKDFFPTRIREKKCRGKTNTRATKEKKGTLSFDISIGRVKAKLVTTFTRQLSTLLNAGVTIVQSLTILESQMKKGLFKKILGQTIADIQSGDTLSGAMAKHPKAFDRLYVNIINAGEVGGALDLILTRLANYREKMQRLKQKIIGSMTYPVAVVIIACAILSGILMFIIPQFSKMFDEMEVSLPLITLGLVNVSNFMVTHWYTIFGIPVALFIMYKLIGKIKPCRLLIDKLKFKVPVFGNLINKSVVSKFVRTLATLTSSGVPILESLKNVKEVSGNLAMTRAIEKIHDSVREGESIAKPLRESKICDSIVVNMIEIGEQSGELDKMLEKVADNYDAEIDSAVEAMISLIEPIMIVFLGGAVGTIVVALFMPLIKLMDALG
ncbi:MAG: type II secretion system F family protein [Candidatus Scalindua sp.]|nr:type II secretion system F family protein [Candidatus Scalindua sp.]